MISLPSSSFSLSSGEADACSSCRMLETVLITPVKIVGHLHGQLTPSQPKARAFPHLLIKVE